MRSIITFLLIALSTEIICAQEKLNIRETKVEINTIERNEVYVKLLIDLEKGYRNRMETFLNNNITTVFKIKTITKKNEPAIETEPSDDLRPGKNFIGFLLGVDSVLMNNIINGEREHYIDISNTIMVELINDSTGDIDTCYLTPDEVKEYTQNAIKLSDEEKEELIQSMGGETNIVSNSVDFGLIPGEESSSEKTEYYIDFDYRTRYRCSKKLPFYFQSSGHLSTNFRDSLNYFKVYPLSYNYLKKGFEFSGLAGSESNQVFSDWRLSVDVSGRFIIPNFINLTFSENRLRLKPIVQFGTKGYYELRNTRPEGEDKNVFSCIAYAQAYYYIPVYRQYFLTFEGNVFYDFNNELDNEQKPKYLYTITAGVEIPDTGIRTIFRYTNGVVDVFDAEYTSTIMIGLLADFTGFRFE